MTEQSRISIIHISDPSKTYLQEKFISEDIENRYRIELLSRVINAKLVHSKKIRHDF